MGKSESFSFVALVLVLMSNFEMKNKFVFINLTNLK